MHRRLVNRFIKFIFGLMISYASFMICAIRYILCGLLRSGYQVSGSIASRAKSRLLTPLFHFVSLNFSLVVTDEEKDKKSVH
jgi:hypothetical protein